MAEAQTATAPKKGGKAAKGPRGKPAGSDSRHVGLARRAEGLRPAHEAALQRHDPREDGDRGVRLQEHRCQVPRLDKIVLNMGVGEAVADTKKVTTAAADLALIAGQKPVITHARKCDLDLQGA